MSKFRFLFSLLAISISVLVVEPSSNLDGAFAQSVQEAGRLNEKANQIDKQGRYSEAEPLYKRSLAVVKKALGHDHPKVAAVLNNLTEVFRKQGRYEDAEPLYKRSLAIKEKGSSLRACHHRELMVVAARHTHWPSNILR
jgi:tetratricopeptide (TPR) repeat protein